MLIAFIVMYLLAGWTFVLSDGWRPGTVRGYIAIALGVLLWPLAAVVLTVERIRGK